MTGLSTELRKLFVSSQSHKGVTTVLGVACEGFVIVHELRRVESLLME
jgi:20S proteasome alpha/beta subunit